MNSSMSTRGNSAVSSIDPFVAKLKAQRDSSAVLKMEFIKIRSLLPNKVIFVFEGIDDKLIYMQWAARLSPSLRFEPFVCKGKRFVLELIKILERDLNKLTENVYYFIDRDFDENAGVLLHDSVFVTDRYAVENYLVDRMVLDIVLTNEFHCHCRPVERQRICEKFDRIYGEFLENTADINFRLFCARKLGISISGGLPDKLRHIARVSIDSVSRVTCDVELIVKLNGEPDLSDVERLRAEFSLLDPKSRYRGKFAYMFFNKWLEMLGEEYNRRSTDMFDGIDKEFRVCVSDITIGVLASRSEMPIGLAEFVLRIGV